MPVVRPTQFEGAIDMKTALSAAIRGSPFNSLCA